MSRERPESSPPTLDSTSADVLAQAQRDVQQRRFVHAEAAAQQQRPWAWAALGVSVLTIAGVALWPSGTLPTRLHALMRGICDQANNLPTSGPSLPLDARCTGIYAAILVTLAYLLVLGRAHVGKLPPLRMVGVALAAMTIMAIDGLNSLLSQLSFQLYPSHNALRLATGLGMGAALAVLGLPLINHGWRATPDRDQRSVARWRELSGIVVLNLIIGVLAWAAPPWLYYPLALLSVVGVVGMLVLLNLGIVILVSGLQRRVLFVGQLARPATYAIVGAIAELLLLGWVRDLSERVALLGQGWPF